MTIELIEDEHCISHDVLGAIAEKLSHALPRCTVITLNLASASRRLTDMDIKILPVWLVDNRVVPVNPFDNHALLRYLKKHESGV